MSAFDKCTPVDLDDILCEVNDFHVMPESQLPTINCDDDSALDQFWFSMGCIRKPGDTSQKRFSNFSRLCKTLLVLPHSNADPERLFSIVQKVETTKGQSKPINSS